MAWFFGKKKEEPVKSAQTAAVQTAVTQTAAQTVQKEYFPERDKKMLKRMYDDAVLIEISLNKPKAPRLKTDELLTAALGFYVNGSQSRSSRYMKDLTLRREPLGEWTYYAINLFAFGEDMTQKEPKMAGDLRMRQIAEMPAYRVQPGDILGVTQNIQSSGEQLANITIEKEALLRALRVRLLAAKSAATGADRSSGDGFTYNAGLADAYLYQAACDLAESDLWEKHPSANKNYYPERLEKQKDHPLALYWLYQCGVCGLTQKTEDPAAGLKKAAGAAYPPAVHELYVNHRDSLSAEEKAEIESQMAEFQALCMDYLLQLDEKNIESFTQYIARTTAEAAASADACLAEELYEKNIHAPDSDAAAAAMFRAAMLGHDGAYEWIAEYACEKQIPAAQAAAADKLYEIYKANGDETALQQARELYEAASAGGSGDASYQLWLNYDDFYDYDQPGDPSLWAPLLKEAVSRGCLAALADYIETEGAAYHLLKVISDTLEKTLAENPSFINKWHAMNIWKAIALSPAADLPLAAFALANFTRLYIGRRKIGTTDYRVRNFITYGTIIETKPMDINGYTASNYAVSGDADVLAAIGEMFRDSQDSLFCNLEERWGLADVWFNLAEFQYLLSANCVNQYQAARLCRFYALDRQDMDKATEWRDKAKEWKSVYINLILYDIHVSIGSKPDWWETRIREAKKTMDPGYQVGNAMECYGNCSPDDREERWKYTKWMLEAEQQYIKQLIDRNKYNVEKIPVDPEGQALAERIEQGYVRLVAGFTDEEQLHIDDSTYIREKYLEQQRLLVLKAVKEHFDFH